MYQQHMHTSKPTTLKSYSPAIPYFSRMIWSISTTIHIVKLYILFIFHNEFWRLL